MQVVLLQDKQVNFPQQLENRNFGINYHTHQSFCARAANVRLSPILTGRESAPILAAFDGLRNRHHNTFMGMLSHNDNVQVEIGVTGGSASINPYDTGRHYDEYGRYVFLGRENNLKFFLRVYDISLSGLLHSLSRNFGQRLKLKVSLGNIQGDLGMPANSRSSPTFDLVINEGVARLSSKGSFGCEKMDIDIAGQKCLELRNNLENGTLTGTLKITAIIKEKILTSRLGPVIRNEDMFLVNKKLLKEEICCDVTIITGNGASIKCHMSFLAAQSSVFQTMFQGSMKETKTGTVEILDMTEASVRALLAFLYYWDTQEAMKNSLICFELFYAGHKYDIGKLEEFMKKIILSKDNKWYDVDIAIRLFLFARNMVDGNELKVKAIQVLKSKFSLLEQSQSYQNLFKDDPKAAMDLCKYAFSV